MTDKWVKFSLNVRIQVRGEKARRNYVELIKNVVAVAAAAAVALFNAYI